MYLDHWKIFKIRQEKKEINHMNNSQLTANPKCLEWWACYSAKMVVMISSILWAAFWEGHYHLLPLCKEGTALLDAHTPFHRLASPHPGTAPFCFHSALPIPHQNWLCWPSWIKWNLPRWAWILCTGFPPLLVTQTYFTTHLWYSGASTMDLH